MSERSERDLVLDATVDLSNAINKLTDARSILHEKLAAIDYVEPPTESVGEIPEGIFDVFQADNSVIVKSVDEYSCDVLWGPLEFRFKKTEAKDGTLFWVWDEIVGTCWMHIEQMDVNNYWMGLTLEDGRSANIHIGAKRAQVDMHGFVESA
jgi:hypothetical protein